MFPYKDDNPTELPAIVTVGIIAANVLVWLFIQGMGSPEPLVRSVCDLGLVPGELLRTAKPGSGVELAPGLFCVVETADYSTLLTSMFTHGGWLHLIGNMVFLWVFGNNIEDVMGHGRFIVFYLLCGVAAAGAQMLITPNSIVPMVGASGAISGVLGAYLLLYPRVRVHTLLFLGFYATTVALPAYLMLGYWIFLQLLGGLGSLSGVDRGGTAFFAHIGGFAAGFGLIRLFASGDALRRRPPPPPAPSPARAPRRFGCGRHSRRTRKQSWASAPDVFRVVFDALALHEEHHVLRDIRGQVGDALQVTTDEEQLHRRADDMRVLHHVGEEDPEHRLVQRVDAVVAAADRAPRLPVAAHEGVERVGEHGARLPGHLA